MSLNAMTDQRPSAPAGDTIIYLQTPTGNGDLDVLEADSWDMAEEEAKQATAADAPVDDADVESASTGSDSGTSSTGSTSSSSGTSSTGSTSSSSGASSSSSTSSSSGAGSTGSATSATASTTASAAASATGKMTAAVPTAVPANAAASLPKSDRYDFAGFCALTSIIFIAAGTVFTLMVTGDIGTGRAADPEEIRVDKALAGIAYVMALASGGLAVGSAIKTATGNS